MEDLWVSTSRRLTSTFRRTYYLHFQNWTFKSRHILKWLQEMWQTSGEGPELAGLRGTAYITENFRYWNAYRPFSRRSEWGMWLRFTLHVSSHTHGPFPGLAVGKWVGTAGRQKFQLVETRKETRCYQGDKSALLHGKSRILSDFSHIVLSVGVVADIRSLIK